MKMLKRIIIFLVIISIWTFHIRDGMGEDALRPESGRYIPGADTPLGIVEKLAEDIYHLKLKLLEAKDKEYKKAVFNDISEKYKIIVRMAMERYQQSDMRSMVSICRYIFKSPFSVYITDKLKSEQLIEILLELRNAEGIISIADPSILKEKELVDFKLHYRSEATDILTVSAQNLILRKRFNEAEDFISMAEQEAEQSLSGKNEEYTADLFTDILSTYLFMASADGNRRAEYIRKAKDTVQRLKLLPMDDNGKGAFLDCRIVLNLLQGRSKEAFGIAEEFKGRKFTQQKYFSALSALLDNGADKQKAIDTLSEVFNHRSNQQYLLKAHYHNVVNREVIIDTLKNIAGETGCSAKLRGNIELFIETVTSKDPLYEIAHKEVMDERSAKLLDSIDLHISSGDYREAALLLEQNINLRGIDSKGNFTEDTYYELTLKLINRLYLTSGSDAIMNKMLDEFSSLKDKSGWSILFYYKTLMNIMLGDTDKAADYLGDAIISENKRLLLDIKQERARIMDSGEALMLSYLLDDDFDNAADVFSAIDNIAPYLDIPQNSELTDAWIALYKGDFQAVQDSLKDNDSMQAGYFRATAALLDEDTETADSELLELFEDFRTDQTDDLVKLHLLFNKRYSSQVTERMLGLLKRKGTRGKQNLLRFLGVIGRGDIKILKGIEEFIERNISSEVRAAAVESLIKIDAPDIVPFLKKCADIPKAAAIINPILAAEKAMEEKEYKEAFRILEKLKKEHSFPEDFQVSSGITDYRIRLEKKLIQETGLNYKIYENETILAGIKTWQEGVECAIKFAETSIPDYGYRAILKAEEIKGDKLSAEDIVSTAEEKMDVLQVYWITQIFIEEGEIDRADILADGMRKALEKLPKQRRKKGELLAQKIKTDIHLKRGETESAWRTAQETLKQTSSIPDDSSPFYLSAKDVLVWMMIEGEFNRVQDATKKLLKTGRNRVDKEVLAQTEALNQHSHLFYLITQAGEMQASERITEILLEIKEVLKISFPEGFGILDAGNEERGKLIKFFENDYDKRYFIWLWEDYLAADEEDKKELMELFKKILLSSDKVSDNTKANILDYAGRLAQPETQELLQEFIEKYDGEDLLWKAGKALMRIDRKGVIEFLSKNNLLEAHNYFRAGNYQNALKSFDELLTLIPAPPSGESYLRRTLSSYKKKAEEADKVWNTITASMQNGAQDTTAVIKGLEKLESLNPDHPGIDWMKEVCDYISQSRDAFKSYKKGQFKKAESIIHKLEPLRIRIEEKLPQDELLSNWARNNLLPQALKENAALMYEVCNLYAEGKYSEVFRQLERFISGINTENIHLINGKNNGKNQKQNKKKNHKNSRKERGLDDEERWNGYPPPYNSIARIIVMERAEKKYAEGEITDTLDMANEVLNLFPRDLRALTLKENIIKQYIAKGRWDGIDEETLDEKRTMLKKAGELIKNMSNHCREHKIDSTGFAELAVETTEAFIRTGLLKEADNLLSKITYLHIPEAEELREKLEKLNKNIRQVKELFQSKDGDWWDEVISTIAMILAQSPGHQEMRRIGIEAKAYIKLFEFNQEFFMLDSIIKAREKELDRKTAGTTGIKFKGLKVLNRADNKGIVIRVKLTDKRAIDMIGLREQLFRFRWQKKIDTAPVRGIFFKIAVRKEDGRWQSVPVEKDRERTYTDDGKIMILDELGHPTDKTEIPNELYLMPDEEMTKDETDALKNFFIYGTGNNPEGTIEAAENVTEIIQRTALRGIIGSLKTTINLPSKEPSTGVPMLDRLYNFTFRNRANLEELPVLDEYSQRKYNEILEQYRERLDDLDIYKRQWIEDTIMMALSDDPRFSHIMAKGPPGAGKTRSLGILLDAFVSLGYGVVFTSSSHIPINNGLKQVRTDQFVRVGNGDKKVGIWKENWLKKGFKIKNFLKSVGREGWIVAGTEIGVVNDRHLVRNDFYDIMKGALPNAGKKLIVIRDESQMSSESLTLPINRQADFIIDVGDEAQDCGMGISPEDVELVRKELNIDLAKDNRAELSLMDQSLFQRRMMDDGSSTPYPYYYLHYNYRSKPLLVPVIQLFYHWELKARDIHKRFNEKELPEKDTLVLIDTGGRYNRESLLKKIGADPRDFKIFSETKGYSIEEISETETEYSYSNPGEARLAALQAEKLLGMKKPGGTWLHTPEDILLITFYKAQTTAIYDALKKLIADRNRDAKRNPDKKSPFVERGIGIEKFVNLTEAANTTEGRARISTVDAIRGDQSKVVIVSFVRSSTHHNIGFLAEWRRLNVALSRAKEKLYLIGDFSWTLMEARSNKSLDIYPDKNIYIRDIFAYIYDYAIKLRRETDRNNMKGTLFLYPNLLLEHIIHSHNGEFEMTPGHTIKITDDTLERIKNREIKIIFTDNPEYQYGFWLSESRRPALPRRNFPALDRAI